LLKTNPLKSAGFDGGFSDGYSAFDYQIKTKSQQIIKHIIHNYAAFDISTIDKFTHKVIRALRMI
jgi:hypothetical protein